MNQSSQLLQILEGCLNSSSVQVSEKKLVQYSNRVSFVSQLLELIPNASNDIVIMIMSTLKNYCSEKYNNPIMGSIADGQKQILRNNLFNLYYIISANNQAVNLYKEVLYIIIGVDFVQYNHVFYGLLEGDLNGPISASVYFCRQVTRFYEWFNAEERNPLDKFVSDLYPKLQDLVEKIMKQYNNQTRKLLTELLEMFYSSFHIDVPLYLRNFETVDKWLLYFKTILKAPIDDYPQNHVQSSRIFVKFFQMYCRDGTDGLRWKGWGKQFRGKYAEDMYAQIVQILVNPLGSEQIMTNILLCLCSVVNNPDLSGLMRQDHVQQIIYKHLLPFMESTNEDNAYFKNDILEYTRRCEDLTCHPFRRVALDLIKCICEKMNFGTKSELMKFVEYSAQVLGGNSTDKQKQVIVISLVQLAPLIMKNQYLRENFQNLTQQYFIPLVKCNNDIIVSKALNLLAVFLKLGNLSTQTVKQLMGLLYEKMCVECLVVKYFAILAFTELLDDKEALQSAKPYFQNILSIYVKLLEVIDTQSIISSLQSIVQKFSHEIVGVAGELSNHLFNLFYSLHNRESEGNEEEDNEIEGRQASAALKTIKQILQSPLSSQIYYAISEKVMILMQNLCSQFEDYFSEILNLMNTLVFRSNNIVNWQFPYLLCRKLLQGNNEILKNCENKDFVNIIQLAEKADLEYSCELISIIKNLIQKMPSTILHRYPYSQNPQILLCLIENKKIDESCLGNIKTKEIDQQWRLILQSYTAVVYGLGEVCDIQNLKMLNGVSLYPWIQHKFNVEVVKRLMATLQDQQAEDDFYEENTEQMLEQLANEEDDDADYYVSDGGNYNYLYSSPYDSGKDSVYMVSKLRELPGKELSEILSRLLPKYASRVQNLLKQ